MEACRAKMQNCTRQRGRVLSETFTHSLSHSTVFTGHLVRARPGLGSEGTYRNEDTTSLSRISHSSGWQPTIRQIHHEMISVCTEGWDGVERGPERGHWS